MGAWIEIADQQEDCKADTVAPFVGAWIEIEMKALSSEFEDKSLPSWERGLKLKSQGLDGVAQGVAPFVGAWIEIKIQAISKTYEMGRSLRGSVD